MANVLESEKTAGEDLYHEPAVVPPTNAKIEEISDKLGLGIAPEEVPQFKEVVSSMLKGYQSLLKYPEPTLAVKYPRTPGYRPPADENSHNAWYYKTSITGAPNGKLKGKKIAIKDNIAVAGVPMMNGTKLMEGFTPAFDATVVTRILDQAGTISGKAVCESFCCSGQSYTSATGPVLNPHNKLHSSGGSSSGAAVLLVLEEVDMVVGSDQGGSIRIPACFSGVVGLKPTWGLVPYTGACNIEYTNDHLGPMARTVHDCALLLEVIAGYDDGLDSRQQMNIEVKDYTSCLDGNITGMKIGLLMEGFQDCESDVKSIVKKSAECFTQKGASIEDVSIPMHKDGLAIWFPAFREGTSNTLMHGYGVMSGQQGYYPTALVDHIAGQIKTKGKDLSQTAKATCLLGEYMKTEYNNRFYGISKNLTRTLRQEYDKALDGFDVLVMPTIKFKAPLLPKASEPLTVQEYVNLGLGTTSNTAPFDATGHPALSINCGFSGGLPVGMMIVGKHFEETKVLKVAHAFEQLRNAKEE